MIIGICKKRIIAFGIFPKSHTGFNVKTQLVEMCQRYNIIYKILSISLDNASNNLKAMEYRKKESSFATILDGKFLHTRCCAHVLNLSVQEGLKALWPLLQPLRQVIKWLRMTRAVRAQYKSLCAAHDLRKMVFSLDCPTRWNSTYIMLCSALDYKTVISAVWNEHCGDPARMLEQPHWDLADKICKVLKAYYDATHIFSLVYESSVHLLITECIKVVYALDFYQDKEQPVSNVTLEAMLQKWKSYFSSIPEVYGVACLLDPSMAGIEGLKIFLDYYFPLIGESDYDINSYVKRHTDVVYALEQHYIQSFSPVFRSPPLIRRPHLLPLLLACHH